MKTANRKPTKPAKLTSCTCHSRPAYHCTLAPKGLAGVVEINSTFYHLLPLGGDTRDGYRLVKTTDGSTYDVDTSSGRPICDCPDSTFRRQTPEHPYCKHSLGLIDLRRQGAI